MACEPLIQMNERAIAVRPSRVQPDKTVAPIHEEIGDLDAEPMETEEVVAEDGRVVYIDPRPVWEKAQDKMEDLTVRVA